MDKRTIRSIVDIALSLAINTSVIVISAILFKNFEVSSVFYAFIASIIIFVLNKTIKPILKVLMIPATVLSLGILYPFVNVFILKMTDLFLGNNFIVEGWIIPFFISIFMSMVSLILDISVTRLLLRGKR